MIPAFQITEFFYSIDDFCHDFLTYWNRRMLAGGKSRIKPFRFCPSIVMTIRSCYICQGFEPLKILCRLCVQTAPGNVSKVIILRPVYRNGRPNDCANGHLSENQSNHSVHRQQFYRFHSTSRMPQSTDPVPQSLWLIGWFYSFKLHLIISDSGHVVDFMLTGGNIDDRKPLQMQCFIDKLYSKLYGDNGYISKELFEGLFHQGIHLVTKLWKNMKTRLVTPIADAILLLKRAICETIIDQLKNIFQIEHSRHRSLKNFFDKSTFSINSL